MLTNTILGQHQFDGPHNNTASLLQRSGVYIISTILHDGSHKVVDVGESINVQGRVRNHDRSGTWSQHTVNGLFVAAHYCDEVTRMALERAVRVAYSPPCGTR